MNKMDLVLQAIGDLEEALSTAKLAVDRGDVRIAQAAGHFANIAASLLLYAAEEEEEVAASD